jgi:hypothetical protein
VAVLFFIPENPLTQGQGLILPPLDGLGLFHIRLSVNLLRFLAGAATRFGVQLPTQGGYFGLLLFYLAATGTNFAPGKSQFGFPFGQFVFLFGNQGISMADACRQPTLDSLHVRQLAVIFFRPQLFFRQLAAQAGKFAVVFFIKMHSAGSACNPWCGNRTRRCARKGVFFHLHLTIAHEAAALVVGILDGRTGLRSSGGAGAGGMSNTLKRIAHGRFFKPFLVIPVDYGDREKR